jgi:hypothetical protein
MIKEFGINTINITNHNRATITGRVFNGVVNVGDLFVMSYLIKHESLDLTPIRVPASEIYLTVTGIEAYGQKLDALDEGLTGLITVCGNGIELLRPEMSIGCGNGVSLGEKSMDTQD